MDRNKINPTAYLSMEEARKLVPEFVNHIMSGGCDDGKYSYDLYEKAKKGNTIVMNITQYSKDYKSKTEYFYKLKISMIDRTSMRAFDGPIPRVSDGKGSWYASGQMCVIKA